MISPLNSLTSAEYIILISTIERNYKSEWNCYVCLDQYSNRDEETREKLLTKRRKLKGCWGNSVRDYRIENIKFSKCIGNFTSNVAQYLIDMYHNYTKGNLPYPGSVSDQPAKVIEAFEIIQSAISQKQKDAQESNRRQKV